MSTSSFTSLRVSLALFQCLYTKAASTQSGTLCLPRLIHLYVFLSPCFSVSIRRRPRLRVVLYVYLVLSISTCFSRPVSVSLYEGGLDSEWYSMSTSSYPSLRVSLALFQCLYTKAASTQSGTLCLPRLIHLYVFLSPCFSVSIRRRPRLRVVLYVYLVLSISTCFSRPVSVSLYEGGLDSEWYSMSTSSYPSLRVSLALFQCLYTKAASTQSGTLCLPCLIHLYVFLSPCFSVSIRRRPRLRVVLYVYLVLSISTCFSRPVSVSLYEGGLDSEWYSMSTSSYPSLRVSLALFQCLYTKAASTQSGTLCLPRLIHLYVFLSPCFSVSIRRRPRLRVVLYVYLVLSISTCFSRPVSVSLYEGGLDSEWYSMSTSSYPSLRVSLTLFQCLYTKAASTQSGTLCLPRLIHLYVFLSPCFSVSIRRRPRLRVVLYVYLVLSISTCFSRPVSVSLYEGGLDSEWYSMSTLSYPSLRVSLALFQCLYTKAASTQSGTLCLPRLIHLYVFLSPCFSVSIRRRPRLRVVLYVYLVLSISTCFSRPVSVSLYEGGLDSEWYSMSTSSYPSLRVSLALFQCLYTKAASTQSGTLCLPRLIHLYVFLSPCFSVSIRRRPRLRVVLYVYLVLSISTCFSRPVSVSLYEGGLDSEWYSMSTSSYPSLRVSLALFQCLYTKAASTQSGTLCLPRLIHLYVFLSPCFSVSIRRRPRLRVVLYVYLVLSISTCFSRPVSVSLYEGGLDSEWYCMSTSSYPSLRVSLALFQCLYTKAASTQSGTLCLPCLIHLYVFLSPCFSVSIRRRPRLRVVLYVYLVLSISTCFSRPVSVSLYEGGLDSEWYCMSTSSYPSLRVSLALFQCLYTKAASTQSGTLCLPCLIHLYVFLSPCFSVSIRRRPRLRVVLYVYLVLSISTCFSRPVSVSLYEGGLDSEWYSMSTSSYPSLRVSLALFQCLYTKAASTQSGTLCLPRLIHLYVFLSPCFSVSIRRRPRLRVVLYVYLVLSISTCFSRPVSVSLYEGGLDSEWYSMSTSSYPSLRVSLALFQCLYTKAASTESGTLCLPRLIHLYVFLSPCFSVSIRRRPRLRVVLYVYLVLSISTCFSRPVSVSLYEGGLDSEWYSMSTLPSSISTCLAAFSACFSVSIRRRPRLRVVLYVYLVLSISTCFSRPVSVSLYEGGLDSEWYCMSTSSYPSLRVSLALFQCLYTKAASTPSGTLCLPCLIHLYVFLSPCFSVSIRRRPRLRVVLYVYLAFIHLYLFGCVLGLL